jgi:hypothetical protein
MSVGVLKQNGAGKIPMSETMGIERLGRFLAGCGVRRGGGRCKKLHFHFLPFFPSASLPLRQSC